jgi:nitrite reductase (NADH) small subunit
MSDITWHRIGPIDDLDERRGFLVDGRVAVFRCGAEVFAVDNTCPHRGDSLADGIVTDCVVTCPGHWWRFDVRTGTRLGTPQITVSRYATMVEDGIVSVALPDRQPERSWRDVLLGSKPSVDEVEDAEES